MNRTEASIWIRKGNFDSLDPLVPGVGLDHPAKLTVDIWDEYERSPERVMAEARRAYLNLCPKEEFNGGGRKERRPYTRGF